MAVLLPIGLALLIVFAFIGIFVGVFFFTIVAQRLVQNHVHLLHRRTETQRVVVLDLADRPELLQRGGEEADVVGIQLPQAGAPQQAAVCRAV